MSTLSFLFVKSTEEHTNYLFQNKNFLNKNKTYFKFNYLVTTSTWKEVDIVYFQWFHTQRTLQKIIMFHEKCGKICVKKQINCWNECTRLTYSRNISFINYLQICDHFVLLIAVSNGPSKRLLIHRCRWKKYIIWLIAEIFFTLFSE